MFRRHGRTQVRCPMLFRHQTLGDVDMVTSNISASGMFVAPLSAEQAQQLLPLLDIGDTVETEVETESAEAELLQLRIVRRSPEGLGLAFVYS